MRVRVFRWKPGQSWYLATVGPPAVHCGYVKDVMLRNAELVCEKHEGWVLGDLVSYDFLITRLPKRVPAGVWPFQGEPPPPAPGVLEPLQFGFVDGKATFNIRTPPILDWVWLCANGAAWAVTKTAL